jgi:hypothetical protein
MKSIYLTFLCLLPFFTIAKNNITDLTINSYQESTDLSSIPNYPFCSSLPNDSLHQDKPKKARKNAIKIHSMLFNGSVALSYERSIKQNMSFEIGAGYIYSLARFKTSYDYGTTQGFMIRGGLKYLLGTDKAATSQLLNGIYLMPELFYTSFSTTDGYQKVGITEDLSSFALTLNAGYQYVFKNSFLLNFFIGGGLGKSLGDYNDTFYYNHLIFSENISFAFTAGFKLGYAF